MYLYRGPASDFNPSHPLGGAAGKGGEVAAYGSAIDCHAEDVRVHIEGALDLVSDLDGIPFYQNGSAAGVIEHDVAFREADLQEVFHGVVAPVGEQPHSGLLGPVGAIEGHIGIGAHLERKHPELGARGICVGAGYRIVDASRRRDAEIALVAAAVLRRMGEEAEVGRVKAVAVGLHSHAAVGLVVSPCVGGIGDPAAHVV